MIFDAVVDDPGMLETVVDATRSGRLQLLATSVSDLQIEAVPDLDRKALLRSVPVEYVGTFGFVLDYSRLDVDRLGPAEPIEKIGGGKRKELEDALIAATAAGDGLSLVTTDRRLRNRVLRELPQIELWSWDELREQLLRIVTADEK